MARLPPPPAEHLRLESLAEVARGGMGSVELARVVEGRLTGQVLAVKRLHSNIAEDPDFVAMFLDEACITAALKHPNVAQVIAWGNDEAGMFLAIECVQGVSLSRLLKEAQTNQEPFAERTVAYLCSQICAGLMAAHSLTGPDGAPLGVVHRDLTPANVLVSFEGMVKIIDFGIAKAEERITHTRTGQLKGKPSYMAPEQHRGSGVDLRADLFAFGVTMFELLAGRRPWTSKGAFDVMMEIASDPHPDLGELRKGLNPEFVEIAHRCLEKKPEARFNSAGEIKARLDAWLSSKGFTADDQQSLAQFVQRNSQPQIKWWAEAFRGEHTKKKTQTFKELEEKIDADRERAARGPRPTPPPRPVASGPMRPKPSVPPPAVFTGAHPIYPAPPVGGQSGPPSVNRPPAAMKGTQPMAAYQGPPSSASALMAAPSPQPSKVTIGPQATAASTAGPSSAPMSPRPPSSGPQGGPPSGQSMIGTAPLPPQNPLSGTEYMSPMPPQNPLSGTEYMSPMPASQPVPSSRPEHNPLSGTEYMAASPYSLSPMSPPAASPRHASDPHPLSQRVVSPSVPPPNSPASVPFPGSPASVPFPGSPPSVPMPSSPPSVPMPMSQATPAAPSAAPASPYSQTARSLEAPAPAPASAPPAKKRGKMGLVIALVAIPVIGAGASAWFFRDTLLNLGGTSATRKAPAGAPAGKR